MSRKLYIDPTTEREFEGAARKAYLDLLDSIDVEDYEDADLQDIAELFFYNGFMSGCLKMHTDENFRETVLVLNEEVKMQTEKK
jgi:hypothetical protein